MRYYINKSAGIQQSVYYFTVCTLHSEIWYHFSFLKLRPYAEIAPTLSDLLLDLMYTVFQKAKMLRNLK